METLLEEDLHWWLWSQSTCRVDLNRPAYALSLPHSQSERLAFLCFCGKRTKNLYIHSSNGYNNYGKINCLSIMRR
jgi:hypothetical protein